MKIFKMAYKWIKYIKKSAELWHSHPELVNQIINSENVDQALKKYYSENEYKGLIDSLNKNHKKRPLVYKGRPLPMSSKNIEVPVQVLITPNDPFIIQDLKNWGLYNTGESYETLLPKIYKKIRNKYYSYAYDRNVWGKKEMWEFPFEVREKLKQASGLDCDSWMDFIISYFIAVLPDPAFARAVAGNIPSGGGHGTIYVFSMKDYKWHHLNSTMGSYSTEVSQFPTHEDARNGKDSIGISYVWFSFNNQYAWADLKEDLPEGIEDKTHETKR